MKIFLAGMDNTHVKWYNLMIAQKLPKYYGLYSYYYLSKVNHDFQNHSRNFNEVLIDSGAHTFHTSKNIDFVDFTKKYADWISINDKKNITGFFEMDIDNRIGYKNVLKLRGILEKVSDKIIPVWHKNRGISKFVEMCQNYDYVSISCLKIENISYEDLFKYVDIAHDNNCKIHGLGGTRKEIIENVPFNSVDSISWFAPVQYNKLGVSNYTESYQNIALYSYVEALKMQKKYYKKWTGEELK